MKNVDINYVLVRENDINDLTYCNDLIWVLNRILKETTMATKLVKKAITHKDITKFYTVSVLQIISLVTIKIWIMLLPKFIYEAHIGLTNGYTQIGMVKSSL